MIRLPRTAWTLALLALPFAASLVTGYVCGGGFDENSPGARLFRTNCAHCHNLVADDSPRYGPSLHEIGRVAGERKPGMSAEEYVLESVVAPSVFRPEGVAGAMPSNIWIHLTDDEIRDLVAFVLSHGGTPDRAKIRALVVPARPEPGTGTSKVDRRLIDEGEAIFRDKGKCINCHRLRPDPDFTLRAPSLLDFATIDKDTIRKSIEEPNAEIAAGYQQVNVPLKSLALVTGRLIHESDAGLDLLRVSEEGELETIFVPRADIAEAGYVKSDVSPMPPVKDVLTPHEIDALVAFLKNRQGGYPGYGRPGMFNYK
jgi:mono/diheme cytochrome c family protein